MTHFHSQHFLESEEFLFYAEPYHFKENETIEPHSHDFFELVYVAQGEGEHLYKGDYFHIHEGDVFMIEPGEEHAYRTGEKIILLWFIMYSFRQNFLDENLSHLPM